MVNKKDRIIKSVSFTEDEYILLKFAEDNGNFSYFIKELIKEKMNKYVLEKQNKEDEIKIILSEIKDKLDNVSLQEKNNLMNDRSEKELLNDEILEEINKFD